MRSFMFLDSDDPLTLFPITDHYRASESATALSYHMHKLHKGRSLIGLHKAPPSINYRLMLEKD